MKNKPKNILFAAGGGGAMPGIVSYIRKLLPSGSEMIMADMHFKHELIETYDKQEVVPSNFSDKYEDAILSIVKKNKIDLIVPCVSSAVEALSAMRDKKLLPNEMLMAAPSGVIDQCIDKYKSFIAVGRYAPDVRLFSNLDELESAAEYFQYREVKFCIKPRKYPDGSGKGFRIVDEKFDEIGQTFYCSGGGYTTSMNLLRFIMQSSECQIPCMMACEYLPGTEYSCYIHATNGVLDACCVHEKIDLMLTNSKVARVVDLPHIYQCVKDITKSLMLDGICNVQLKTDTKGDPKLVEVNPRIAGTIMLSVMAGVDLLSYGLSRFFDLPTIGNLNPVFGVSINRGTFEKFIFPE